MLENTIGKLNGLKAKAFQVKEAAKTKAVNFFKEEKSAKVFAEEGWMIYAVIVLGIIVLLIATVFMDDGFNAVGNFFNDGVNGQTDETGLNKWADQTDGFNRE